jgi:MBG domain
MANQVNFHGASKISNKGYKNTLSLPPLHVRPREDRCRRGGRPGAYNGNSTSPTAAGSYPVVGTVNDPNYTGSATETLVIAKATPIITWSAPDAITYGPALSSFQLKATATVAGTFACTPALPRLNERRQMNSARVCPIRIGLCLDDRGGTDWERAAGHLEGTFWRTMPLVGLKR